MFYDLKSDQVKDFYYTQQWNIKNEMRMGENNRLLLLSRQVVA